MWLLANTTSWLMFLVGVGLMTAILLRRYFRYYHRGGRKRAEAPLARAKPNKLEGQPLADAPRDVLRWQVEMHETARDLKAEIDSKLSVLQTLVSLADEQTTRLEAAIARAEALGVRTDDP